MEKTGKSASKKATVTSWKRFESLARIEDGTYGICSNCHRLIPKAWLKAVPWTRFCLACMEARDS
ncbi:MAG: hypothetical protein DMG30_00120 [Acidobacteria bacterium]|nr:MAG: hypothetical protein DMG30_00120 [Acidobacteriota bacterium]